jgi:hypothetical protein
MTPFRIQAVSTEEYDQSPQIRTRSLIILRPEKCRMEPDQEASTSTRPAPLHTAVFMFAIQHTCNLHSALIAQIIVGKHLDLLIK